MKKHIIIALFASIPLTSSSSFFSHDFRYLREIADFLEEQDRRLEEHMKRAFGAVEEAEPKSNESIPKVDFERQKDGCQLVVSNLETTSVDVSYEEKVLRINFDSMNIGIQQASYAQPSRDKYVTIDTKLEFKSTTEENDSSTSFTSYARSREVQMIDRELDFEKTQPRYDTSKKLLTVFIPYKETKTIVVEMVS